MKSIWDERFSDSEYKYGTEPNAFLKQEAHRIKSGGRVLVPADGEGRNSVWLAEQGFDVTAVDGSSVGLEKGRLLAERHGVSTTAVLADLNEWTPDAGSYDAVVLTYLHLMPAFRTSIHRTLTSSLKPDGILILEAFSKKQLGRTSGGPDNIEMLFTIEDLRHDFNDILEEQLCEECETVLDEGPGHQGVAYVARYIGVKAN